MTDIFKPIDDDRPSFANGNSANSGPPPDPDSPNEAGRTLLFGLLGGLVTAAGYAIYTRLPDEQRDKLNAQVRGLVESRVNDLRSRLNI
ncbi:MAG: hypothetical protein ACREM2_11045 [Vulcanimicrobiaceae bacterium]